MRTCSWIELTLFALLLVGAGSRTQASAQQAPALRPLRVDDYFALKNVGGPRVSPDGAWVAYTVRAQDLENMYAERDRLALGCRWPWERSVSHRRVVGEAGDHHRVDHQVPWQKPVERIHVEVMRARSIVDPVLEQLEAREAGLIERQVVRSPVAELGKRLQSEICEGLHPCLEDRRRLAVALQMYAAELSCSVVHVEVH